MPALPAPQMAAAPQIARGTAPEQSVPIQPIVGEDGMVDAAEAYRARLAAQRAAAPPPAPPPGVSPEVLAAARTSDGQIDAAEMRRAQLRADRAAGVPTYSVQREWEGVEAAREASRAATGSPDNRVIPGSVPVLPPDWEEREAEPDPYRVGSEPGSEDRSAEAGDETEPARRRPGAGAPRRSSLGVDPSGGARGRERATSEDAQAEQSDGTRRGFFSRSTGPLRRPRPEPDAALDREPTLAGGPG
jgi:hypothetical protein